MTRFRSTAKILVPAPLLAALALAIPGAADAAAPTVHLPAGQPTAKVLDYWTKARMRAADPVTTELPGRPQPTSAPDEGPRTPTYVAPADPGADSAASIEQGRVGGSATASRSATLVADPSAPKIRAHGKVFFRVAGGSDPGNFVCSGTAVNSRNKSLVMTAGHCVYDAQTGGGKSKDFMFVPGYRDGTVEDQPFGVWTAKSLATAKKWKRDGNLRYDIGAAILKRDDSGRRLQSVVGARGIGFDQPRDRNYVAYGYPQLAPFDGYLEYTCPSAYEGSDSAGINGPAPMAISCDMTAGASGGGWIIRNKTLVSITSYGYDARPGVLYGPYFSTTAKKLYKQMRGSKKKHKGGKKKHRGHGGKHRHR